MAVIIKSELKVKCVATGEWIPKHITLKQWYPVVGINSWQYKDNDGKVRTVIKFIVINDVLQLTQMAEFNCQVLGIQDEEKEIDIPKDYEEEETTF